MIIIFIFILFLFSLPTFCHGSMKVVNCTYFGRIEGETNLAADEYVLFQTPNFPLNENEDHTCEHKFIRSDNETNIWFVFLNGHINYFYITGVAGNNLDDFETKEYLYEYWDKPQTLFNPVIPYSVLEFKVNDVYNTPTWWGFQAFIYAPSLTEKSTCPFNGKTFILENNLDIIPITSNYNYETYDASNYFKNCTWHIEIPSGYNLKINIKYGNMNMPGAVSITIDDDIKPVPITLAKVQYFNGTKFSIYYENFGGFEFASFITTVEANPIMSEGCYKNVSENGLTTTTFENYDEITGYGNNEVCEIKIPINSSTFQISYFGFLDDGSDQFKIYDNINKYPRNSFSDNPGNNWIIDANISVAKLNFSSDGSIVSGGFQVNITKLSCECSNSTQIFFCESEVYFFNVFKDGGFCSGVTCNFTLTSDPKCGNFSSLLIPIVELRYFAKDSLKISENDKLFLTLDSSNSTLNHYLFNPQSKITINFKSDKIIYGVYQTPSLSIGAANLNTTPFIINLTPDNFTYTLNAYTMERSFFTVNAPENYTLDLFVLKSYLDPYSHVALQNTFLYASNTTNNYAGNLWNLPLDDKNNLLRYYPGMSQSLTIFKAYHRTYASSEVNFISTLFFRIRQIHSKNCANFDNVFYASNTTFIAKATETGPCMVTVLLCDIIMIDMTHYHHFQTDATENVKLIAGSNENYTFFEFNSKTISTWPRLFLYGLSNSFIIPANSYLKFTSEFSMGSSGYKWFNVKKGLHTSKTFVNPWTIENSTTEIKVLNDTTCRLTVKFLDLSTKASLNLTMKPYIPKEEPPLMVTNVSQTFDFTTNKYPDYLTILINLQEPIIGHRGYVIEFEMLAAGKANLYKLNILFMVLIYIDIHII